MRVEKTDVLVIGAGGAGLRAALAATEAGATCIVLGKTLLGKAHTVMAEGGINAALGNVDSQDNWHIHAEDTIAEGIFLSDPTMVETLTKNAADIIFELESYGALFDRTPEGKIMQRAFGAHRYKRTCHIADRTGLEIMTVLVEQMHKHAITSMAEVLVTKLFTQGNIVTGAFGVDLKTGEGIVFQCKAIVLATGGFARLYKITTNAWENVGDGVTLAYNAGAELMDMEMIQFHPTGMVYPDVARGILVTESVRGEGGRLYNHKKERFMEKYDKQRMELSARDIVARANYNEIFHGRGSEHGGVYLDISHKGKAFINKKLPKMVKLFKDFANIDITKEAMEVAPTAHYTMGGVRVNNKTCMTCVKGLFAAGEIAAGVHGANRLGGNSLTGILVFGKIAGNAAGVYAKKEKNKLINKASIKKEEQRVHKPFKKKSGVKPESLKIALQEILWKDVGIVRTQKKLQQALKEIDHLKKQTPNIRVTGTLQYNHEWMAYIDVHNMLSIAEFVVKSALERKESRGAHYREDFPKTKKEWAVNIICQKKKEKLVLNKKKVPTVQRGKK